MTDSTHSSVQEALDWFAQVGWADHSPARRHFQTLVEQFDAAVRQIQTEHIQLARDGGGPCVCKWCASREDT